MSQPGRPDRAPKAASARPEHFFAPCPRGLERVLADELVDLGAGSIRWTDGGVGFTGPFTLAYAVNLESRVASRVLWRVGRGTYRNEADIYHGARRLRWCDWFGPDETLRVNVAAIGSPLKSLNFATLRIKDAVCDAFRDAHARRPDVDTRFPDVRIHAFLTASEMTLYLDTSGEPLFKRGYRARTGDAPLRENLAAGVLRLCGWRPGVPLLDPMCGSGAFLCEAAMMVSDIAPGARRRFGFEKLSNFDRRVWQALRHSARLREQRSDDFGIYGSDRDRQAVRMAHDNLKAWGLAGGVRLSRTDVLEAKPPAPSGLIVTNPPYGVRIEEQARLAEFYPRFGDVLKKRFSGWTAYVLTADMRLPKLMRLSATKRTPLFNGPLECRLFEYKMVEGRNRKREAPRA